MCNKYNDQMRNCNMGECEKQQRKLAQKKIEQEQDEYQAEIDQTLLCNAKVSDKVSDEVRE